MPFSNDGLDTSLDWSVVYENWTLGTFNFIFTSLWLKKYDAVPMIPPQILPLKDDISVIRLVHFCYVSSNLTVFCITILQYNLNKGCILNFVNDIFS